MRLIVFTKDFWEGGEVGFPTILVTQKVMNKDETKIAKFKAGRCDLLDALPLIDNLLFEGAQRDFNRFLLDQDENYIHVEPTILFSVVGHQRT